MTDFIAYRLLPLNGTPQKITPKHQSSQRLSSLHMARKTRVKPVYTKGLQGFLRM